MIAMLIKKIEKKILKNNSPKIPQADREHGGMTVFKKTTEMYIFYWIYLKFFKDDTIFLKQNCTK